MHHAFDPCLSHDHRPNVLSQCSRMTEEEVAASRASLEAGGADDAAIMRFIAAFMTAGRDGGGGDSASNVQGSITDSESAAAGAAAVTQTATTGSGHAPDDMSLAAAAEPEVPGSRGTARQNARGGDSSSTAAADATPDVAAVANMLHRLPAQSPAPQYAASSQPASTAATADAIASGQFDWAAGFPSSPAAPPQSSAGPAAAATPQQNGHSAVQPLPAGGSSAAAEAILSGQFQWGGGGSIQPQPLQHAALQPQVHPVTAVLVCKLYNAATGTSDLCDAGLSGLTDGSAWVLCAG